MPIPTRNNPGEGRRVSPVQQYYRIQKDAITLNTEQIEPPKAAFSTIATRFFLYSYEKKTEIGFESTEYNLTSDIISVYKKQGGKSEVVFKGTVKEARAENNIFDGEKLLSGMAVYCHDHNTGTPCKIQLPASGRSIYMDFQEDQKTRFPDFFFGIRETTKKDRELAGTHSLPDYLPTFDALTSEQGMDLNPDPVNETDAILQSFWNGTPLPQQGTTSNIATAEATQGETSGEVDVVSQKGDDMPF